MSYRSCNPCGGSSSPRDSFQSVPRYSEITRKSGGLSTDLDALKSIGIFEDGDAIETRIGEGYIQVWVLYPGSAEPGNELTVPTADYSPTYHNFHWVLASGYVTEDNPYIYIPPPPPLVIPGCIDPTATNYNPYATISNGSCEYSGPPTFYNSQQQYTQLCPNGQESVNATYTVPAGIFSSNMGQADADALAMAYAQASVELSISCYSYSAATFETMPTGGITPLISVNYETALLQGNVVFVDEPINYAYADFENLVIGFYTALGGGNSVGDTSFSIGSFNFTGTNYADQAFEFSPVGNATIVETGATTGDTVFSQGSLV